MRRRPQPNFRRGFLRAAAAVVGLTIVIVAVILVVATLTAPKVKAPTIVPTPTAGTRNLTPQPLPTSSRTQKTAVPTAGTKPTGGKKKSISMRAPGALLNRVFAVRQAGGTDVEASPNGRYLAYFHVTGNAYARNPLYVRDMRTGASHQVGYGDPLVRLVWSNDSTSLLYARVSSTRRYPGADWSLVRTSPHGGSQVLAHRLGMTMLPLGWSGGRILYLVSTVSDTSIYAWSPSLAPSRRFLSILYPQVITGALLSPDGHSIGFLAPTNCGYCTASIFNLATLKTVYGPAGARSEWDLAWSADSRTLLSPSAHGLALTDAASGSIREVSLPRGLEIPWRHPMRATIWAGSVSLVDTITGQRYETPM